MLFRSEIRVQIRNIKVGNKTLDTIYGIVHPIYDFYYDNFCDNASVMNFHERIITALEKNEVLQDSQKTEEEDVHRKKFTTTIDTDVLKMYRQVTGCESICCRLYQISCDNYVAVGHFDLNCPKFMKDSLKIYTHMEYVEYTLYKGAPALFSKSHKTFSK